MKSASSLLLITALASACAPNDSTGPTGTPSTLENQVWASSLNINLATMTKLPSGMYVLDQVVGTGTTLTGTPTVRVYYNGYLANGSRFDGNVGAASPASFQLGGLIQGWQIGMQGMKVGGKRRLVIPASLGYGTQANGPIPANSNLVFDIELVGIS